MAILLCLGIYNLDVDILTVGNLDVDQKEG
jgi:hypothetical protein